MTKRRAAGIGVAAAVGLLCALGGFLARPVLKPAVAAGASKHLRGGMSLAKGGPLFGRRADRVRVRAPPERGSRGSTTLESRVERTAYGTSLVWSQLHSLDLLRPRRQGAFDRLRTTEAGAVVYPIGSGAGLVTGPPPRQQMCSRPTANAFQPARMRCVSRMSRKAPRLSRETKPNPRSSPVQRRAGPAARSRRLAGRRGRVASSMVNGRPRR